MKQLSVDDQTLTKDNAEDINQIEYIINKLPDFTKYLFLNEMSSRELYYRGIYELFLRNTNNINSINLIIKLYDFTKDNIEKLLNNDFINDEDKETCLSSYDQLKKGIRNIFLKIKHYKENNVYSHPLLDNEIFNILNILNELSEMYPNKSYRVKTKITNNIFASHEPQYPYDLYITYKEYQDDIILVQLIHIDRYVDIEDAMEDILESDSSLKYSYLKKLLKEVSSEYNNKDFNITNMYTLNDDIYPIINNSSKITSFASTIVTNKIGNIYDMVNYKSPLLEDEPNEKINSEAYKKLLNILTNADKLIQFLYIYDSYTKYNQKIKFDLQSDIENKNTIDKVSIQFLWTALAKKLDLKPKTVKNYFTMIDKIINEKYYKLV